jgi:hypothetical protein
MVDSIEDYYDYIEQDKGLLIDLNLSKNLKSIAESLDDELTKQQCLYELFVIEFHIENGLIKPIMSGSYKNGNQIEYPSLNLFNDDLNYIKQRAITTKNPKYIARYSHLIWGKNKHQDYGKKAIDNYFEFLKLTALPLNDNLSSWAFGNYFKNLFILSQTINYKKEEVIQYLLSILESKEVNQFQKCNLVRFVIDPGNKIEATILNSFMEFANKMVEVDLDLHTQEQFLELQLVLSQKLQLSQKPYLDKLGEVYCKEAALEGESFGAQDFYLKALNCFKKAGSKERIEEVSVLVEKAKRTINLKKVSFEYKDDILNKWFEIMNSFTDNLSEKYESNDIYEYLILSDKLLPKAELLDQNIRPVTFDLVSVMSFDINKNISKSCEKFINSYSIHFQNFSIQQLWMIFRKGITSKKISADSLLKFLNENTWYGVKINYSDDIEEVKEFCWNEVLSPSITHFFSNIETDLASKNNDKQNYILSVDSLVIKFEGLLREFSRRIGAQTIEITKDGTKEIVSFDKLFDNEKIKQVLPPDDLAYFKYLFLKDGMNLRNNIAHCFYKTENYSSTLMLLLIVAILRLGNYKFSEE